MVPPDIFLNMAWYSTGRRGPTESRKLTAVLSVHAWILNPLSLKDWHLVHSLLSLQVSIQVAGHVQAHS